jgi:hypothetical protein
VAFLKVGQRVRVQSGPLTGAQRIFMRIQDDIRLIVSVTLLRGAIAVFIEKEAAMPLLSGESQDAGLF